MESTYANTTTALLLLFPSATLTFHFLVFSSLSIHALQMLFSSAPWHLWNLHHACFISLLAIIVHFLS